MEIEYDNTGYPRKLRHPRYIFRYLAWNANTEISLREGYLWFSSIKDFNDPFDSQNLMTSRVLGKRTEGSPGAWNLSCPKRK
jgi:hypothetical protein